MYVNSRLDEVKALNVVKRGLKLCIYIGYGAFQKGW
jgi:hypothetical protein